MSDDKVTIPLDDAQLEQIGDLMTLSIGVDGNLEAVPTEVQNTTVEVDEEIEKQPSTEEEKELDINHEEKIEQEPENAGGEEGNEMDEVIEEEEAVIDVEEEEVANESDVEEEVIIDNDQPVKKKRKWNKRLLGYEVNKKIRQQLFSKKKNRLLSIAKEMEVSCGGKVYIKGYSEAGKMFEYGAKKIRHVNIQTGNPAVSARMATRASASSSNAKQAAQTSIHQPHTPKKVPCVSPVGMSGKRRLVTPPKQVESSKCGVCHIIYNSKKDIDFQKKNKKEGTWLGCQQTGCGYWAHAKCVGVKVGRKNPEDIPFFCMEHKQGTSSGD